MYEHRGYFRKFVKAWNRGKLPRHLYSGVDVPSASSQTAYRWSFASKASGSDTAALRAARNEVGSATHGRASTAGGSGRVQGPTLPTASDMTLARETADEYRTAERDYQRKRERKQTKERVEEMVGPKPVGREGMLEKKRAQRENDRAFREGGDEGLEVDESTIMGGGSSFKDECVYALRPYGNGMLTQTARFQLAQARPARCRAAEIRGEAPWGEGGTGVCCARSGQT
ncbi:hypothetical protein EVJ58_g5579 [Rhodofomes roseus]|uniref:Uncharacterized protein n=1 Tax=Rhodofomes roseus TaxID=34475 RepID=A0A4Y9YBQ6_9APHY|nr:hypothetical protein EVJ58_g5579 [Rhodofomes roseus]